MIDLTEILFISTLGTVALATSAVAVVTIGSILPAARYFKVGGLRFFRLGRFQISFCIVTKGK